MARILLVLDGGFRFSDPGGTPDFTYSALVDALTTAGHQVTKAHRQSDPSADHSSFNFATTVDLLTFDVLWMIGNDGRNVVGSTTKLPDPQLGAIARFMTAGGGVFATGDHDSIGGDMCGHIPRVRAMRSWFGEGDGVSPMPASFPRNFPPLGSGRADTTRRNPAGDYDLNDDGTDENFVWFENQSDAIPQIIAPVAPVHPILKRGAATVTVYPDHMHEGNTLGEVAGYAYDTASASFDGETFTEFPLVAGHRELPRIVATGQTNELSSRFAFSNSTLDGAASAAKTVNTLSAYDGREVGVGRVVTGSTFHHYVDINLTGDSRIDTPAELDLTGPDAAKTHGFNDAPAVFDDIRAVFDNIATWLARPRPRIQLILERSTFSQAEATANPLFEGAIFVTVDGLKPSQFAGVGAGTLSASNAPTITPQEPNGLTITPTAVTTDDPGQPDRLQRVTFVYRVEAAPAAFTFPGDFNHVRLDASLGSAALSAPLTDSAQITLVKSANPFMLDLAGGNETPWLSSDVRVFTVVAGSASSTLPANASRAQAIGHLQTRLNTMTVAEFEALPTGQAASALSPFETTTGFPPRKVYNFAVARVRVPPTGATANGVRVFFRIFTSQTTAALTYEEAPVGTPIKGYRKTTGANPIALPGTNLAGTEWLSFPMFAAARLAPPEAQTDLTNVEPSIGAGASAFFGCLIDSNLPGAYLPPSPGGGAATDLPALLMGEHQCLVAQIEFPGTPIPNGANPFTSDKLSQRNIALSPIANPGVDASRQALHTFEIEAAPQGAGAEPPDELMLDWTSEPPEGTEARLFIPSWNAAEVIALADRLYPRHELRALDAHTVAAPGGGARYAPIPPSASRQTGVAIIQFPLGVKKGDRFDLAIRQITTRERRVDPPRSTTTAISREEAAKLIQGLRGRQPARSRSRASAAAVLERGVFDLGSNRTLITDLSVINAASDEALIVEHPAPEALAAARARSGRWRETVGAFQIGAPVSVKDEMLPYHLRLLSVLRWRAEKLPAASRWRAAFLRYVELTAEKVRALGGDPYAVPATPTGVIEVADDGGGKDDSGDGEPGDGGTPGGGGDAPEDGFFEPGKDDWLGETGGLPPAGASRPGAWSGKVEGLLYDHFGDFEGFVLEDYAGGRHRFHSREPAIRDIVEEAWRERSVVTVITVRAETRLVRRVLVRGRLG